MYHLDESLFPDPWTFDPGRWLENPELNKYIWSFSRGPRQCVGLSLAYAELYLCLAAFYRRYGTPGDDCPVGERGKRCNLLLFETDEKDVRFHHDLFVPFPERKSSNGVRVLVTTHGDL